jgi:hypothetical protein
MNPSTENILFKRKVSLRYVSETGFLFLEYLMPSKNELSSIKEIALSPESGKFEEIRFTEKELNNRYKLVLYKIMFKALFELFHLDKINALNEITFRGTMPADETGSDVKHTIPVLSFTIKKDDFLKTSFDEHLNLEEYFISNGGVYIENSSSTNHQLISIQN